MAWKQSTLSVLFTTGVVTGALISELSQWYRSYSTKGVFLRKLSRIYAELTHRTRQTLIREDSGILADLLNNQLEQHQWKDHHDADGRETDGKTGKTTYLAVDIGATRTKLKWVEIETQSEGDGKLRSTTTIERTLDPLPSRAVWGTGCWENDNDHAIPELTSSPLTSRSSRQESISTQSVCALTKHLGQHNLHLDTVNHLVFSVPGTVDLSSVNRDDMCVVKNMPSFSESFRGFDFKKHFRPYCHRDSKVSAIADNLAAAMGVSSSYPQYRSGLVITLGTAPSVATFYKQTDHVTLGKQDPYLETAIWQSWVWFTKIELRDPYGYCGGVHVRDHGKTILLKPSSSYKIPHGQSRIRFALDNATLQRLLGKSDLPEEVQANLTEEEVTAVWAARFQCAVNALAQKFHMIYGPPDCIFVLGGNSMRLYGQVTAAEYKVPDMEEPNTHTVAVSVLPTDKDQQNIHMNGLITSTRYKVKHVFAPGSDPLSRGWTRGGEIYVWVPRYRGDALLKKSVSHVKETSPTISRRKSGNSRKRS